MRPAAVRLPVMVLAGLLAVVVLAGGPVPAQDLVAPYAPLRQLKARPDGKGNWDAVEVTTGRKAGQIRPAANGGYRFYDEQGTYRGSIIGSGLWVPLGGMQRKRTQIDPASARLYLEMLGAVQSIR